MEVKVIRSARRRKTVSARLIDGVLVVRAPQHMTQKALEEAITTLKTRLQRRQEASTLSDEALQQRAQMLNRQYFGGKLRWRSIRWVTNQQRIYGSCTPQRQSIRISHRLGKMPQWVQDYVIIHELAHLLEPNHGPRFWQLVNRYPKTERARGYLMAVGLEPMEDAKHDDIAND